MPLFGDDITVTFGPTSQVPITEYVLTVQGSTLTKSDFAWILLKFFECKESFEPISSTTALRKAVAEHYNAQPPHPGYNAELTAGNGKRLAMLDSNALAQLKKDGFVVVDMDLKTSKASNQKLSEFLVQSTGQGPSVRRDTVAFLDKKDAMACGLEEQYNFLMSIASHLNHHFSFPNSAYQPLAPGTHSRPLTNPKHIQAAEYGMDGFYVAHSDNSIADENIRSNFRCYTCILYCNDDWTAVDGGALRIYRDSSELKVPADALTQCSHQDIIPENGRLVIFDSKLVHSVERVSQDKRRRALTLWILRPEDSGARGDVYYFGEHES